MIRGLDHVPTYHLVFAERVSKIEFAHMLKGHMSFLRLVAIHDQRIRNVSRVVYINGNLMVTRKLTQ